MCNWFCAPGCAGVLTQAQVKHVLVKLHKRLLPFGQIKPLCRPAADCPNPSRPYSHCILPLSLSHNHSLSLMLSVPSLLVQYVPTQPSRAKLSWPGPPACRDSNGFNKNTVWWMRIEFHTWTPRHYMCFFLIKKGVRAECEREGGRERAERCRATRPKEDRLRLFSFILTFLLPEAQLCACCSMGELEGTSGLSIWAFPHLFKIRLNVQPFQKLALRFVSSLSVILRQNGS